MPYPGRIVSASPIQGMARWPGSTTCARRNPAGAEIAQPAPLAIKPKIVAATPLPFLDMRDVTIARLRAVMAGGARIGLLASPAPRRSRAQSDHLAAAA